MAWQEDDESSPSGTVIETRVAVKSGKGPNLWTPVGDVVIYNHLRIDYVGPLLSLTRDDFETAGFKSGVEWMVYLSLVDEVKYQVSGIA